MLGRFVAWQTQPNSHKSSHKSSQTQLSLVIQRWPKVCRRVTFQQSLPTQKFAGRCRPSIARPPTTNGADTISGASSLYQGRIYEWGKYPILIANISPPILCGVSNCCGCSSMNLWIMRKEHRDGCIWQGGYINVCIIACIFAYLH